MDIIKIEDIEEKIIILRDQKVILDKDVAEIYGVETKRVNEAVKNNSEKFPEDYKFKLSKDEFAKTRTEPFVFTEKGLYMIATVLKSKKATDATFAIIETFAKVKELTSTINELSTNPPKEQQQSLMQKSGEIISELLDNDLQTNESETTIELNFAVLKFKHTVKKGSK